MTPSTTITPEAIETTVYEALETFGADASLINRDADFKTLDVDSLDLAELAQIVEDKFGVTLESADLKKITTVGDVLDIIGERTA